MTSLLLLFQDFFKTFSSLIFSHILNSGEKPLTVSRIILIDTEHGILHIVPRERKKKGFIDLPHMQQGPTYLLFQAPHKEVGTEMEMHRESMGPLQTFVWHQMTEKFRPCCTHSPQTTVFAFYL